MAVRIISNRTGRSLPMHICQMFDVEMSMREKLILYIKEIHYRSRSRNCSTTLRKWHRTIRFVDASDCLNDRRSSSREWHIAEDMVQNEFFSMQITISMPTIAQAPTDVIIIWCIILMHIPDHDWRSVNGTKTGIINCISWRLMIVNIGNVAPIMMDNMRIAIVFDVVFNKLIALSWQMRLYSAFDWSPLMYTRWGIK